MRRGPDRDGEPAYSVGGAAKAGEPRPDCLGCPDAVCEGCATDDQLHLTGEGGHEVDWLDEAAAVEPKAWAVLADEVARKSFCLFLTPHEAARNGVTEGQYLPDLGMTVRIVRPIPTERPAPYHLGRYSSHLIGK